MGNSVGERAQEAVQEMAYSGRESGQLYALHDEEKIFNYFIKTEAGVSFKEGAHCMLNVTHLEVCLEDMFCTSGDQLTDSYSLYYRKRNVRMAKREGLNSGRCCTC